jgi:hypothetical protein
VESTRKKLSSSVRAAVPYFHKRALANMYQTRSLEALRMYERAHDVHLSAKKAFKTLERRMTPTPEKKGGGGDVLPREKKSSPSVKAKLFGSGGKKSVSAKKTPSPRTSERGGGGGGGGEDDGKREEVEREEDARGDEDENATAPAAAAAAAEDETRPGGIFDADLMFAASDAISDVVDTETMKKRAELAHKEYTRMATKTMHEALVMQRKSKKSVEKARPYFEAKARAEADLARRDEEVRTLEAKVKEGKERYAKALENLSRISEEIHERRERERVERENGGGGGDGDE